MSAPSASRILSSVCHGLLGPDSSPPTTPTPTPVALLVLSVLCPAEAVRLSISLTLPFRLTPSILCKCHRQLWCFCSPRCDYVGVTGSETVPVKQERDKSGEDKEKVMGGGSGRGAGGGGGAEGEERE